MRSTARTMHRPQQYDLFTGALPRQDTMPDDALQALRQEVAHLRQEASTLRQQLRDAQAQTERAEASNRSLHRKLLAAEARPSGPDSGREALAWELIKLAHPDKWSQGQLATELAHEITVRLNAGRRSGH